MALREIIQLPDARLKEKSAPVSDFGVELKKLVADMTETMREANGIGLAAIQVAVPKRLLVLDLGDLDEKDHFIEGDQESESQLARKRKISKVEVFVNPVILSSQGETSYEEGCLSVPGVFANVRRAERIRLRYQDIEGSSHEVDAQGLRAIALQHEIDHLDGIVFPDRLGPMQRMMLMAKYKKLRAEGSSQA